MSRQGARISLAPVILAVVFPAIVGAAIALAYYGYRYAVAASVRSKASLMEGNQQLANLLMERCSTKRSKSVRSTRRRTRRAAGARWIAGRVT